MQTEKKTHPHGLPHLSDAEHNAEVLAGSSAWAPHIQTPENPKGEYTFAVTKEIAIDDDTDLLIVVRKRIAKKE